VDYYLRPKLAWYAIKRELRPINVTISRTDKSASEQDTEKSTLQGKEGGKGKVAIVEIWGSNATLVEVEVVLKVEWFDITSGKIISTTGSGTAKLLPNQATLLEKVPTVYDLSNTVISAAFTALSSSDLSRDREVASTTAMRSSANWPQPIKYLDFSDRGVSFSVEGEEITLRAGKPTKGVILDVEGDNDSCLEWSDNGFDIMPGEIVKVVAKGLGGRKVTANL
jgi:beta-mannosidase